MVRRAQVAFAGCLAWLASNACGRIDFDRVADAGGPEAAIDASGNAPTTPIVYVAPFVQRKSGSNATDSFAVQARAARDAIVIQVSCAVAEIPSAVLVVAPGWSFTQLGTITVSTTSTQRSATFVAIAPDAVGTTISVTWGVTGACDSANDVGDEFAMTDPAGGMITFDGSNATMGDGNCTGHVTTGHAADAVWAACNSAAQVTAIDPRFHMGASDGVGDWSEYRITNDPAGTVEEAGFDNPNVGFVQSMVTLKPQQAPSRAESLGTIRRARSGG